MYLKWVVIKSSRLLSHRLLRNTFTMFLNYLLTTMGAGKGVQGDNGPRPPLDFEIYYFLINFSEEKYFSLSLRL